MSGPGTSQGRAWRPANGGVQTAKARADYRAKTEALARVEKQYRPRLTAKSPPPGETGTRPPHGRTTTSERSRRWTANARPAHRAIAASAQILKQRQQASDALAAAAGPVENAGKLLQGRRADPSRRLDPQARHRSGRGDDRRAANWSPTAKPNSRRPSPKSTSSGLEYPNSSRRSQRRPGPRRRTGSEAPEAAGRIENGARRSRIRPPGSAGQARRVLRRRPAQAVHPGTNALEHLAGDRHPVVVRSGLGRGVGQEEADRRRPTPSEPSPAKRTCTPSWPATCRRSSASTAAAPGQPQFEFFATADQALFMENGDAIRNWTAGGVTLIQRLTKQPQPAAFAEELYLSVLNRRPTAERDGRRRRLPQDATRDRRPRPPANWPGPCSPPWSFGSTIDFDWPGIGPPSRRRLPCDATIPAGPTST